MWFGGYMIDFNAIRNKLVEIVPGEVTEIVPLHPGYENTNLVLEVSTSQDKHFILKLNEQQTKMPSTFWQGLNLLFGAKPANCNTIVEITQLLNKVQVFPIPKILNKGMIETDSPISYLLLEKMPGLSVLQGSQSENEFMNSGTIAYEIGQYLGKLRKITYATIGDVNKTINIKADEFPQKLTDTIKQLANLPPAIENNEVQSNLNEILQKISVMPIPQFICPIMPDFWPSQFLWEHNHISALIDVESYVHGPIELELAVLELWLEDFDSLQRGYLSEGVSLPDLSSTRDIYRFLLYLLHGCPTLGLSHLFSSKMKC